MRMKRLLLVVMSATLFTAIGSGCSQNSSAPGSKDDVENFRGELPPKWKNWQPGMPMPNGAKEPANSTNSAGKN